MTLIERQLLDVTAVAIHHMQDGGMFITVLIQRGELWLAFIQQDGL